MHFMFALLCTNKLKTLELVLCNLIIYLIWLKTDKGIRGVLMRHNIYAIYNIFGEVLYHQATAVGEGGLLSEPHKQTSFHCM